MTEPVAGAGMRPEFMTVKELAVLLRVTERKVYDLAAQGQVPCSRATGKLLFPADEIDAWIAGTKTGPGVRRDLPAVFLGSHDPLLEWALRQSGSGLATFFTSSMEGLKGFEAGDGVAAGLHLHEADGWNEVTVREALGDRDAVLVRWSTRRRGLVLRPDVASRVSGVADLKGLRVAPRQTGAGAEVLFAHLLRDAGVAQSDLTLTLPNLSEQDAVLAVLQNEADVAFGLETVSAPFGLTFVPLVEEEFDIVVDRRAWFEPPMQKLMSFAQTYEFLAHAERIGGVDVGRVGTVRWNA